METDNKTISLEKVLSILQNKYGWDWTTMPDEKKVTCDLLNDTINIVLDSLEKQPETNKVTDDVIEGMAVGYIEKKRKQHNNQLDAVLPRLDAYQNGAKDIIKLLSSFASRPEIASIVSSVFREARELKELNKMGEIIEKYTDMLLSLSTQEKQPDDYSCPKCGKLEMDCCLEKQPEREPDGYTDLTRPLYAPPFIQHRLSDHLAPVSKKQPEREMLVKIKQQFDERKRRHIESAEYQPEKIDSKWSAGATGALIDLLYLTVEEIMGHRDFTSTQEKQPECK